ncbi:MAG TPA: hypothetical protein VIJ65_09485 [Acidobacteriaceae bacterium]
MPKVIEANSNDALLGIIERLALLETTFGSSLRTPLQKFRLSTTDDPIIAVQKAGRRIAQHLNLSDLTFIVLIRSQEENVAGRIHIDDSPDMVQIELSTKIVQFPEVVLSTLCHEITHKYLSRHNIKLDDTLANEKLTDTASVYLGLGIFMLEGCECERTTYLADRRSVTSTHMGYLSPEEFSLTFALSNPFRQKAILRQSWSPTAVRRIEFSERVLRARNLALDNECDIHGEMLARIEVVFEATTERCNRSILP